MAQKNHQQSKGPALASVEPSAGRTKTLAKKPLTAAQSRVYEALVRLSRKPDGQGGFYPYQPTLKELAAAAGLKSESTTFVHIRIIADKGHLRISERGLITILAHEVAA